MKNQWLLATILIIVVGGVLLGASYAFCQDDMHQHAQHQQMSQQIKVGKTGDMRFDEETRVGDLVLPPGEYRFVHRVAGEDHFVQFVRAGKSTQLGGVKCQLEPLAKKASRTAVFATEEGGGARRITRIEVAGENVAHVF